MIISDALPLKILMIGDQNAGKTSLITAFKSGKFNKYNTATVAVDLTMIKTTIDQKQYDVALWDTAGQEKYRSIVKLSSRDADCALLCFDLSNENSFAGLEEWINFIRNNCPTHMQIVVVGTKSDLECKYQLLELEKSLFSCCKLQTQIIKTSAYTQDGVQQAFNKAFELGAAARYDPSRDSVIQNSFVLQGIDQNSKISTMKHSKLSNTNTSTSRDKNEKCC